MFWNKAYLKYLRFRNNPATSYSMNLVKSTDSTVQLTESKISHLDLLLKLEELTINDAPNCPDQFLTVNRSLGNLFYRLNETPQEV